MHGAVGAIRGCVGLPEPGTAERHKREHHRNDNKTSHKFLPLFSIDFHELSCPRRYKSLLARGRLKLPERTVEGMKKGLKLSQFRVA